MQVRQLTVKCSSVDQWSLSAGLLLNVWSSRKVNKTLMQDIERAQADMRVAEDKQKDCSVDLTKKDSTIRVTANL